MRFFDLHCDTITECYKQGKSLTDNDLHIALNRGKFDQWGQVFAIWIPDSLRGKEAWAYFENNYEFYKRSDVFFCEERVDLEAAFKAGKCAAVLAVEGGAVLMGEPENVQRLYEKGVRLLTVTWNGENELGYGCQSGDGHLKKAGFDALRAMEKCSMVVDVSHLNRTGFYEVLEFTDAPVIASHSTSASVLSARRQPGEKLDFAVRRALTDDQAIALKEHGGLIGLNFYKEFLGDEGDNGAEAILRHLDHFLQLVGEDYIAIGSDFDGCEIHPDFAGIEKIPDLYDFLCQNGLGKSLCDKIFFNNCLQFWKSVL